MDPLAMYQVTAEAVDGADALERWSQEAFDFTLLDCQMPDVDGYDAVRLLRDREKRNGMRRVAVIGLTANVMAGDREKCLEAGMDDYLAKPLELGKLALVLSSFNAATVDASPGSPESGPEPTREVTVKSA